MEENSKILYVHPYNNYTGSTKVISDLIKATYSNLNGVTVITETSQDGFLSDLGLNLINVPILRYNKRAIPVLSAIVWVLVGFFKTLYHIRKYDTVYINTILPGFAAVAAALCKKKIVYHVHEIYIKKNSKSWFGELIFNNVRAHRIFVSNYLKNQYQYRKDCTHEVIYNKLGCDFLKKMNIVPVTQHKRNHVLMLATLQRGKGLDVFVEAARLLPHYTFSLVLSSTNDQIERLFSIDKLNNLTIYPKQSDVHPFYQSADVVLNLSDPNYIVETFGLTIMEGMAYGLPAIVPTIGGPCEVIKDKATGYCIDVTNPNEVVKYIIKITETNEYNRLYNNSLERSKLFMHTNEHE